MGLDSGEGSVKGLLNDWLEKPNNLSVFSEFKHYEFEYIKKNS